VEEEISSYDVSPGQTPEESPDRGLSARALYDYQAGG
jgi:hypothetical protein